MALTSFQRTVCRTIAQSRIASGESYVAGGAALNEMLGAARLSRDVDLFHDTESALDASWASDRRLLEEQGFEVRPLRERASFVEAEIRSGLDVVLLQWVRDSAFRFFPLVEHELFGLALHPFDLATNKVLALVGRLEVRDWVDLIECSERVQPLGYLAWAASGKDAGFSPAAILAHAARTTHYSAEELQQLAFAGAAPEFSDLASRWRGMLSAAGPIIDLLPAEHVGKCAIGVDGSLFKGDLASLNLALADELVSFRVGHIGGALPQLVWRV
jgi:hypothetical protein